MRPTSLAFVLALGLVAGPVLAQTTVTDPAGFGGLAETAGDAVNVTADDLEINEEASTATFTGDVVVTQGAMRLTAPVLLAAYGEGGPSDLENFSTSGGRVTMSTDEQTVEADSVFYDFTLRVLTFSGNVLVTNPTGTVNAERLVIDTRAGTSSFTGSQGSGGRVTSTFTPGN
ncbi:LptA/OstA family protein [Pelagibacterium lacus]|nr:LptA/OstA family protein [Pelagibacterium lacus]